MSGGTQGVGDFLGCELQICPTYEWSHRSSLQFHGPGAPKNTGIVKVAQKVAVSSALILGIAFNHIFTQR